MVGDEAIIATGESEPCVEQLRFVLPDLVPGIQALLAAKGGGEGRDNAMSPD
jgi:hypothetical protein